MQRSSSATRLGYVPALDGLRGLAVAGVVLFHLGYLDGGFLAVDFFFTLSGFLITSLLLGEWAANRRISLGAFWVRRVKRLMPAIVLVLLAVALYGRFGASPAEAEGIRADGLWALAYAANWHSIFSDQGYWSAFQAPSLLDHFWSLAIEEQFYLVWPLITAVTLAVARGRRAVYGSVCAALAVASGVAMIVLYRPGGDPSRVYQGTDTRAGAILLGALLAVCFEARAHVITGRRRAVLEVVGVAAGVGVLAAWCLLDGGNSMLYRGGFFALGVAATAVIAACAHNESGRLARVVAWRPLVALGVISYGLYLWHYPVIVWLTPARAGVDGVVLDGLRVVVSLGAAIISYLVVEKPIRVSKLPAFRVAVAAPIAIAAAAIVLIAATRVPEVSFEPVTVAARPIAATADGADTPPPPPPPHTVLVVGDSVAERLVVGMNLVAPPNVTVVDGSRLGCPIVRADDVRIFGKVESRDHCANWPTEWAQLVTTRKPDAVLGITGPWDRAAARMPGAGDFTDVTDLGHARWLTDEYRVAIDVLTRDGARAFWMSTPCVDPLFPGPDPFSLDERRLAIDRVLDELSREQLLTVLPLPPYECHGGSELVDGIHWSDPVAARVATNVMTEVLDALDGPPVQKVAGLASAAR